MDDLNKKAKDLVHKYGSDEAKTDLAVPDWSPLRDAVAPTEAGPEEQGDPVRTANNYRPPLPPALEAKRRKAQEALDAFSQRWGTDPIPDDGAQRAFSKPEALSDPTFHEDRRKTLRVVQPTLEEIRRHTDSFQSEMAIKNKKAEE